VRSGFPIAVTVKGTSTIFWDVTPCSLLATCLTACSEYSFSILKMEAPLSTETSVKFYKNIYHHTQEDSTVQYILNFLLNKMFKNRHIVYGAKTKEACNSEYRNVRYYDGLGEKKCMKNIGGEIS
jgi:hypothetical protein